MEHQIFTLKYPWDINGYKPKVDFYLSVEEKGFLMHIVVRECNPRRIETEHQSDVYKDSCVEWFVNFLPESCDRYFNFEVNPHGAMYAAFRKNRQEYQLLTKEDIETMEIKAAIYPDTWEVSYKVPFSLISKYIFGYQFQEGMTIRANFYKCGDGMPFPHYGMWNEFHVNSPDFHRPEYFGDIILK